MMIIPFDTDKVKLTSAYGERTLNGVKQNHSGYDLVGVGSYKVTAPLNGVVVQSRIITDKNNPTWQWGEYICIQGEDGNYHYFCHLKERYVKVGDEVYKGDKIGYMGNTGYSFGAHLHYEVRNGSKPINPECVLGIPNKVGIYCISQFEKDCEYLEEIGIMNPAEYWIKRESIDKYFPALINNIANKFRSGGK